MKRLRMLTWASLSSATLLLLTQPAFGLGLGRIQLQSYLNQPLEAEVAINALGDVSPSEIRVRLGTLEAFEKAGIERPFYLTELEFNIVEKDGRPFVQITSFDPVKDPFLSFVVEANWASGRVLREYTLLLDPIEATPKRVYAKKEASKTRSSVSYPKKSRARQLGESYGPVRAEDTLWDIAARLSRQTGGDVNQSMLAIAKKNPRSFIRGNIHGLRKGSVVSLPTKDEILQISVSEAIVQVAEHQLAWSQKRPMVHRQQKRMQKPAVKEKPLQLVMPSMPLTKPETQIHESEPQAPLAPPPKEVEAQPIAQGPDFQDRLLMIEEALDTLKRTNQGLKENQKSLVDKNKLLIELLAKKDEQIKLLSKPVVSTTIDNRTTHQQNDTDTVISHQKHPAAIKTEASKAQASKLDLPKVDKTVETKANYQVPAATQVSPQVTSPAVTPAPPSKALPAPIHDDSSWWMMVAGLLAISGIGVAGVFYSRKKGFADFFTKSKGEDAPVTVRTQVVSNETSSPTDDIREAFSVFDDEQMSTSQTLVSDDVVALQDKEHEQAQAQGQDQDHHETLENHEAENILSDADVYIAYERYDQAESILKPHLDKTPTDWQAHLKLLEVYQQSNRISEFTNHLNLLPHDLVSQAPDVWHEIQTLIETALSQQQGASSPSENMLEQPSATVESHPQQSETSPTMDTAPISTESVPDVLKDEPVISPLPVEPTLPASDNMGGMPNLADKCGVSDKEVKFDMSDAGEPLHGSSAHSNPHQAFTIEPKTESNAAEVTQSDESFSYLEEKDEADTKLALAQAYLDLDDMALAKEHLEQVIEIGNEAQKGKAIELLNQLKE